MNPQDIRAPIERAERMLSTARSEYTRGNIEDTQEFLRASVRNLNTAIQRLDAQTHLVSLDARRKERAQ